MNKPDVYTIIDIGTNSIKALVAEKYKGRVNVIGSTRKLSSGVNQGVIVDIDKAAYAIRQVIESLEDKANVNISELIAGVPSNGLQIYDCQGMVAVSEDNDEVSNDEIVKVSQSAASQKLSPEQEVIDLVPKGYTIDGFSGIDDPRGMSGVRLEMSGLMFTGPKTVVNNLRRAVNKAGYKLSDVLVTSQTLGGTILDDGEQDFGTVILDLGAGQTTATVVNNHYMQGSYVENAGGNFVTKDISTVLNTSLENAEEIKISHGIADSSQAGTEKFLVNVVGHQEGVKVSETYLSEIIEARLEQIFKKIKSDLDSVKALDMPGGIVLIGGGASMPGIVSLVKNIFGVNVKVFIPDQMGLRYPTFGQVLSLCQYEMGLGEVDFLTKSTFNSEITENYDLDKGSAVKSGKSIMSNLSSSINNHPSKSSEGFVDKVKTWFSDFFD